MTAIRIAAIRPAAIRLAAIRLAAIRLAAIRLAAIRLLAAALGAMMADGAANAADPVRDAVGPAALDAPLPSRDLVLRDGVPVTPEEWHALTSGRTVWYFARDGLWGRELYRSNSGAPADGGLVTFEHRDGECLDARWAHSAGLYCFDFGAGTPHCFRHLRWQDRLFAISVAGDVQEVKRIDRSGVSCGAPPVS
jgi:hypothetical protein